MLCATPRPTSKIVTELPPLAKGATGPVQLSLFAVESAAFCKVPPRGTLPHAATNRAVRVTNRRRRPVHHLAPDVVALLDPAWDAWISTWGFG